MYQYQANTMRELRIGRQGENAVRQILFDISDWAAELGPGTAELIYQRSGREDPYPVMVGLDGNTIIWTVTARDTEYPYRNGKCELRYYVTGRDGVAKSRMWNTYVEPSIETPAGDPPETEHGWFDQVISAGADAKAFAESAKIDADRAEAAAIRQPYPDAESGTWWIWDAAAGEYVDSGVSLGQELMEQILAAIGNLDDLKTSDKSSLVAAINEIIRSGVSGGVDPADIAKAVEDYMAAHPIQETDPTVPAWAKQPEKPTYTASEVGALPDTYTPPVDSTLTQTGQAADAAAVGEQLSSLSEEIATTAESKVAAHNSGTDTHSDIRVLIQGLTDRLNALADSDDTTLDQLSEVVAYIKSNRSLIEAITTSKVSVADIIDNLTTNVSNKPLSAAQGVALKALIDAITVPDKLPNPNALTFTGAVTGSYDGSAPLTVEIPIGGGGEWETVIDTTFTESAVLDTGEMPGKTEMLCVFAVPKSDSNVTISATSAAYGKSLNGFAMGSASYGKIGVIYAKKICGHAIAYAGSGDTTSTNPGLDITPRVSSNLQYYRITTNVTDIPLKLTSALPAGTIIKVFVR